MAADPTPYTEAFSISHAAVLNGAESADDAALTVGEDIYGVRSGTLVPNFVQWEHEADNGEYFQIQALRAADISVESGYVSFPVLELITGKATTISGAGSSLKFQRDLWAADELNRPTLPLLLRCPARDSLGRTRRLDIVLYAVEFRLFETQGATYKEGMTFSYTGKALPSLVNEIGGVFAGGVRKIGRLIAGAPI